MIATLPFVVHLFIRRMRADDVSIEKPAQLMKKYEHFLQSFWRFGLWSVNLPHSDPTLYKSEKDTPLPPEVSQEVLRIVEHLIDRLDSAPSGSELASRYRLTSRLIHRLLSPRYLTVALRELLLRHFEDRGTDPGPWAWNRCMLSAVEEGNTSKAKLYRQKRYQALAHSHKLSDEVASKAEARQAASPTSDDVPWRLNRQLRTKIDKMIIARTGVDLEQLIATLEPYLCPTLADGTSLEPEEALSPHPSSLVSHAWSILLQRYGHDPNASESDLSGLFESMPDSAVVAATVTPVMHGLVRQGNPAKAWDLWRDLVARENAANAEERGTWVDRKTLAVATEACYAVSGLEGAVTLVDLLARRPRRDPSGLQRSIVLDAQNVNVLLDLCKRSGKPSIAFRLWAAAMPRWGVWLDDISLNLVLDTARFADNNLIGGEPDLRFRLRALAAEMRAPRKDDPIGSSGKAWWDAYDAAGFARGEVGVLLDPERYSWIQENGTIKPWEKARLLFREVVLGNWPHLAQVKSPLDLASGPLAFLSSFYLPRRSNSDPPNPSPESVAVTTPARARLPLTNARYTHIIPSSISFQSYIGLLGYWNRSAEIPFALAWMKELSIKPTYNSMCAALLFIAEVQPPRRWVAGWGPTGGAELVSDEEIVRRWLEDWLGDGMEVFEGVERRVVPDERAVAALHRQITAKRWLTARNPNAES
jgi:pentatricopeptide repeat protein